MGSYRIKLQRRKVGFMCMAIIAVTTSIIDVFVTLPRSQNGMIVDVSSGIIISLGILSILKLIQLRKVLKDENQIKLLYNKENDERLQSIRGKSGMPMMLIMSIIMFISGIIGSYFSDIIFYTLFAAGFVQLFVGLLVKLYYMKTM
ncbi:MAG: hypothetical protein E7255_03935 [Lachnospiraceae bacterium]|jgi:hypothetical protein|nr:hypothetical protein [Lachnospiraceae bacterium]